MATGKGKLACASTNSSAIRCGRADEVLEQHHGHGHGHVHVLHPLHGRKEGAANFRAAGKEKNQAGMFWREH